MEWLLQYLLFFAKIATVVVAIVVIFVIIVSQKKRLSASSGSLRIKDISQEYDDIKEIMLTSTMSDLELKQYNKDLKKKHKQEKKQQKAASKAAKVAKNDDTQTEQFDADKKPRCYVMSFNGSVDAHEVEDLRQEVTAILAIAKPQDEVVIKLESPGGVVHGYGLAASQLMRFRQNNILLTAVIDKVAASGGYMMACTANKIVAAPFAIVGSIGVVAQIPNFHRLLKKNDIDIELQTAGQYKRTLTMLGENTDEGREKFKQELEETHLLFKDFVQENRPHLNIDKVATGEHWFATQAINKGLVDEIATSDDYILSRTTDYRIIEVKFVRKQKISDKITKKAFASLEKLFFRNSRTL